MSSRCFSCISGGPRVDEDYDEQEKRSQSVCGVDSTTFRRYERQPEGSNDCDIVSQKQSKNNSFQRRVSFSDTDRLALRISSSSSSSLFTPINTKGIQGILRSEISRQKIIAHECTSEHCSEGIPQTALPEGGNIGHLQLLNDAVASFIETLGSSLSGLHCDAALR